MKFLIDTNFLLIPFQFRVDVFSELTKFGKPELFTLNLVVRELDKLSRSKGREGKQARLAMILLKKEGVEILPSSSRIADAGIVAMAAKNHMVVCTQDKALIKKLKAKEIHVVMLRQKRYLVMK